MYRVLILSMDLSTSAKEQQWRLSHSAVTNMGYLSQPSLACRAFKYPSKIYWCNDMTTLTTHTCETHP